MSDCLNNKPDATPFSETLNGLGHLIPFPVGAQFVSNFSSVRETMLAPQYAGDTLPLFETFNLQSVHDLLTQPKAIGFRVYLGMDDNQKVRIVMVGVDSDGMDIIQRYQNDPMGDYPAEDFSILVDEQGQRWP